MTFFFATGYNKPFYLNPQLRPYVVENTGSRSISDCQATNGWVSTMVGDHMGIPSAVVFYFGRERSESGQQFDSIILA